MANINGQDLEKKQKDKPKLNTLEEWVQVNMGKFQEQIQAALPAKIGYSNMASIALNILRADTNLQKATPISFICAVLQAVQLNLEPNTALGQCYIIPYWNSKIKRYEAQFQLGYKGILEMGYRTNEIIEIDAEKVFKGDIFDWQLGTDKFIKHKPVEENWEYDKETGLPIVTHYYAIFKTTRKVTKFVVWTKNQVVKHMTRFSPAAKKDAYSPWNTTPDLMSQKTALRDLMRYAPLSPDDRRVLETDETVKKEISSRMIDVKPIYEFNPDDTKGIDDADFEGKTIETDKESGKKEPGQKKDPDKGKEKGSRKEQGDSKTGPAGKDGKGKGVQGSSDEKSGDGPGTSIDSETDAQDTTAVTEDQIDRMFALATKASPNMNREKFIDNVKREYKLNSLRELVKFQYDQVCDSLQKVMAAKEKLGEDAIKGFDEAEKKGKI